MLLSVPSSFLPLHFSIPYNPIADHQRQVNKTKATLICFLCTPIFCSRRMTTIYVVICVAIILYVAYLLYQHFCPSPNIDPRGKYVLISGYGTGSGYKTSNIYLYKIVIFCLHQYFTLLLHILPCTRSIFIWVSKMISSFIYMCRLF